MGTPGPPEDDAAPDGAWPPVHVEPPTGGRPKVHDPFGRGGGDAFASFFGAWPPAALLFFGLEAIGLTRAEGSKAVPDEQAKAGGQRDAAEQDGCGLVILVS